MVLLRDGCVYGCLGVFIWQIFASGLGGRVSLNEYVHNESQRQPPQDIRHEAGNDNDHPLCTHVFFFCSPGFFSGPTASRFAFPFFTASSHRAQVLKDGHTAGWADHRSMVQAMAEVIPPSAKKKELELSRHFCFFRGAWWSLQRHFHSSSSSSSPLHVNVPSGHRRSHLVNQRTITHKSSASPHGSPPFTRTSATAPSHASFFPDTPPTRTAALSPANSLSTVSCRVNYCAAVR